MSARKRDRQQLGRRRQQPEMSDPWFLFSDLMDPFEMSLSIPTPHTVSNLPRSDFLPFSDVKEDEKGFVVCTDLPGLKKENINLRMENGKLIMEGERKEEKEEKDEKTHFHKTERRWGKFYRSFELPDNIDEDSLKANFKDGVLKVCVSKKPVEQEKTRQINIE